MTFEVVGPSVQDEIYLIHSGSRRGHPVFVVRRIKRWDGKWVYSCDHCPTPDCPHIDALHSYLQSQSVTPVSAPPGPDMHDPRLLVDVVQSGRPDIGEKE